MNAAKRLDLEKPQSAAKLEAVDMVLSFIRNRAEQSQKIYNYIWRRWCAHCESPFCAACPLTADDTHASLFIEARRREGIRDITLRHQVAVLHKIYSYLQEKGAVRVNPWADLKQTLKKAQVGRHRPSRPLTQEQTAALLDAADPYTHRGIRDRAILGLLWSGFRVGEVVGITIADCRTTTAGTPFIHLPKTKAGRGDDRALPPWCAERMEKLLALRREGRAGQADRLIVHLEGRSVNKRLVNRPITSSYVATLVREYAAKAGLPPNVTPHWGRCTTVCQLLESGVDPSDITRVTGHASIAMVEYYDRRKKSLEESAALTLDYFKRK